MASPTGNRGLIRPVSGVAERPHIAIVIAKNRWTRSLEVPKMVSKPSKIDASARFGRRGRIWEEIRGRFAG
jgi:hypothetical protein